MWARHRHLLGSGGKPVVPTVVLAQAWRGGPQPMLSRLLNACAIEDFTERAARATGTALAADGRATSWTRPS